MNKDWIEQKLHSFTCLDGYIERSYQNALPLKAITVTNGKEVIDMQVESIVPRYEENRRRIADFLLRGLRFVNKQGQPLKMMKPLKLDPALLEQPLYH